MEQNGLTESIVGVISKIVALVPWPERRRAMGEVTTSLLNGKKRVAEDLFGWGRSTVDLGLNEMRSGINCRNDLSLRHKPKTEEKYPEMLIDIKSIMDPECRAQQSLRTTLSYTNKTAASVRSALLAKGWPDEKVPTARSISNILYRQNYRLRQVEKTQVQKKNEWTDPIFENVRAANIEADNDPDTVRISVDTKATINVGEYSRNGKSRGLEPVKALDHDMMAKEKLVPGGILETGTGKPFLFFTSSNKTSDFLADGIDLWWNARKMELDAPKRLVINMDNGPECSGRRGRFLQRMVEFSEREEVEVRLAYYPPYHSKYNSIEHYWGGLERSWNGYLLDSVESILGRASSFCWRSMRTTVTLVNKVYEKGIKLCGKEKKALEAQLCRSPQLPFYDISIKPKTVN
jgi:hypothetical protein